jgi:asparagine synthase (glutamine-hydrolysing)
MCGIVGHVLASDRWSESALGAAANAWDAIRHRGPDGAGEMRDGRVWMAHRRLAIIDLSDAASQPMQSADGRGTIVYNGELYNYKELWARHGAQSLKSQSDTEVVLELFNARREGCLSELNGMFAFGYYDRGERCLWLVRDRLGIKPLYYSRGPHGLSFASEIAALAPFEPNGFVLDTSRLHEWLHYGNVLGGATLIDGIQQVLPGHGIRVDIDTLAVSDFEYWSLPRVAENVITSRTTRTESVRVRTAELLEAAVRRHLISDVPVGVMLSGGIDSSAIACIAARDLGHRLRTYTAGFSAWSKSDERQSARRLATELGTEHHEFDIRPVELVNTVEELVRHHSQPFSDAANVPLYLIASEVAGTTKVVLQGDGGDELFGGYRRYAALRFWRALGAVAPGCLRASKLIRDSELQSRVKRYATIFMSRDVAETIGRLLTAEDGSMDLSGLIGPDLRGSVAAQDPFRRYRECQRLVSQHFPTQQLSLIDLMVVLPDIYLEKVDRATMAASVEVRVPFLDAELVEYVARLDVKYKFPLGRQKWLLKRALRHVVPDYVLNSPKRGFDVPVGAWLRSDLRNAFHDYGSSARSSHPGLLDYPRIDELFRKFEMGHGHLGSLLWKFLNLYVWLAQSRVRLADR